jgi:hypothetical protein
LSWLVKYWSDWNINVCKIWIAYIFKRPMNGMRGIAECKHQDVLLYTKSLRYKHKHHLRYIILKIMLSLTVIERVLSHTTVMSHHHMPKSRPDVMPQLRGVSTFSVMVTTIIHLQFHSQQFCKESKGFYMLGRGNGFFEVNRHFIST